MIESMGRFLAGLLLIVLVTSAGLYVAAGRTAPPALTIDKPDRLVGQTGTVEVTAAVPRDRLTALTVTGSLAVVEYVQKNRPAGGAYTPSNLAGRGLAVKLPGSGPLTIE